MQIVSRTRRAFVSTLAACALLAGAALPAAAQASGAELPEGVVARVHGKDIRESELLDRIARTYGRSERGRESLHELVDDICVEREATRRGVTISDEEVEAYLKRWDQTIRQQSGGEASLEDLYEESSSREEFLATAREFLRRQKMAREDLGSKPDEDLSEHYLKLWLSSLRRRAGVRYEDLPSGVVAQVADQQVTRRQLAQRIREKLPEEMVAAIGNELVIAMASQHDAEQAGVVLTEADLDEAMRGLRERFAAEPQVKGSGVTFDQFLKETRGYGESELRGDPVFRARIALRRMLEESVDDQAVREHWETHRAAYGELALVRQIFFQYGDSTGEFALPSREEAWEDALGARVEIFEAAGLHLPEAERPKIPIGTLLTRVAKRLTRDEERRRRAGEPTAWTRLSVEGEEKLAAAVFDGPLAELQGPIRSAIGYHLVVVDERRPAPAFDEIRERIRDDLVQTRVNDYQLQVKADSENVIRAW
jgi:hypothetical protein